MHHVNVALTAPDHLPRPAAHHPTPTEGLAAWL